MQAVVQFVNRGFSERAAKMIDYLSRYNYGLHSYGLQSYGLCTYGSKYDGLPIQALFPTDLSHLRALNVRTSVDWYYQCPAAPLSNSS